MSDPSDPQSDGGSPFAQAAHWYVQAGWAPLPLPPRAKEPPPFGWTGRDAPYAGGADVQAWLDQGQAGNIALRLPPTIIGIDVDNYGDKTGGATLAEHEARYGPLPPTWRSTSRNDGISGIRLYTIPAGLRWPGVLRPGSVETIRFDHRYAVAWPSVHPSGATYQWIDPDGLVTLRVIPRASTVPALPPEWVAGLTGGAQATDQPRLSKSDEEANAWLAERGAGPMCSHVRDKWLRSVDAVLHASSRHDEALTTSNSLLWSGAAGHTGIGEAVDYLRQAFLQAVAEDGRKRGAPEEWQRMLTGGVNLASAQYPVAFSDPCLSTTFADIIGSPQEGQPWTTPLTPMQWIPAPSTTTSSPSTTSSSPSSIASSASSTQPNAVPTLSKPSSIASSASSTQPNAVPTLSKPSSSRADEEALGFLGLSLPSSSTAIGPTAPVETAGGHAEEAVRAAAGPAQPPGWLAMVGQAGFQQDVERARARRAAEEFVEEADRDALVAARVRRMLLDDDAKTAYRAATDPRGTEIDDGLLVEILARPEEPDDRVEGLVAYEGSVTIVAQRKAGKTTFALNLAHALLTGEPFLGVHPTMPYAHDERVGFLNYEVSGRQVARWADRRGVPADRLYLVNLRGRRNLLATAEGKAELARRLREQNCKGLVVDPFGRAYTGANQNDNGEVTAWLTRLDEFARDQAGCRNVFLTVHAGWGGERSRGASALEDWPDSIINLYAQDHSDDNADDLSKPRFYSAIGRDVEVAEDQLDFAPATSMLRASGTGGRKRSRETDRLAKAIPIAFRIISEQPGISGGALDTAIRADPGCPRGFGSGQASKATGDALEAAKRVAKRGSRGPGGFRFYPVDMTTGEVIRFPSPPTNPQEED